MNRMKDFTAQNPTGTAPGMEAVNIDVLKAAVANDGPVVAISAPVATVSQPSLTPKNLRLPSDLVDYIDYVYTKDRRMKKQDAYTLALEAFFRPLMLNRGNIA